MKSRSKHRRRCGGLRISITKQALQIADDGKSAILTQGGQRLWVGLVTKDRDTALAQQARFYANER